MTNIMAATTTALKVIAQTTPSATAAATIYTVPASTAVKVATATVTNTHASTTATISVYVNGTAKANAIVYNYSLVAGDTISLTDLLAGLHLDETNTIGFQTSLANDVNVVITAAVLSA
jgi:hypothetical protein